MISQLAIGASCWKRYSFCTLNLACYVWSCCVVVGQRAIGASCQRRKSLINYGLVDNWRHVERKHIKACLHRYEEEKRISVDLVPNDLGMRPQFVLLQSIQRFYCAFLQRTLTWSSLLPPLFSSFLLQAIENGRNLVALSCSIKLVNAIVSAEKRETPITDVSEHMQPPVAGFLGWWSVMSYSWC